jgi:hypothetical protein
MMQNLLINQDFAQFICTNTYKVNGGLPHIEINQILPNFSEEIVSFNLSDGSDPMDYAVIKSLARNIPDCAYLEIGLWRGESIANVAEVAKSCVSVSLCNAPREQFGLLAKRYSNIDFFEEDSMTFDFRSLKRKFDLIFIDGNHHWKAISSDTRQAFSLLRDRNSMIVWHDYSFNAENGPSKVRWTTLAGLLEGTPPLCRKNIYYIANTRCAIYTGKELTDNYHAFPRYPEKIFRMKIEMEAF